MGGELSACSVGWFVSLLVREEVLLAGLCERKILFQLEIYDRLRQATAKQTGWVVAFFLYPGDQVHPIYQLRLMPATVPIALHPQEQLAQLTRKQYLQIEVPPSSIPQLYMQSSF